MYLLFHCRTICKCQNCTIILAHPINSRSKILFHYLVIWNILLLPPNTIIFIEMHFFYNFFNPVIWFYQSNIYFEQHRSKKKLFSNSSNFSHYKSHPMTSQRSALPVAWGTQFLGIIVKPKQMFVLSDLQMVVMAFQ